MTLTANRRIAARFLPNRYYYWYTLSKLATDPLYDAVRDAFAGTHAPVLDIGCGLGLLLHHLRAHGVNLDYFGVDNDAAKIATARAVATANGYTNALFEAIDPAQGFPQHHGSVALLDVLQFFEPEARAALIAEVVRCLTPGALLVIRAGLEDESWRAAVSRTGDRFAHLVRWMSSKPKMQPSRSDLEHQLRSLGLSTEFRPLWGYTPFNNWLIVARRK